jgi:formylglycine-generating enzyme required for sulfatase activity
VDQPRRDEQASPIEVGRSDASASGAGAGPERIDGPSPQGSQETRLTWDFQELSRSGLFDAIVDLPWNASKARGVLASIGYPRGGRPRYPTQDDWRPFWMDICESIEFGVLASGTDLLPLVQAVARLYPTHPVLKDVVDRPDIGARKGSQASPSPAPLTPPAGSPTPQRPSSITPDLRDRTPPGPTPVIVRVPGFTNSMDMTMVRIEPGEFLMGSTKAQIDKLLKLFPDPKRKLYDDEQPQHPVKITRPFYLAAHPVTVGQFRRFVESSGYKTEAEQGDQGSYARYGKEWKLDPKKNWKNPGFSQRDDHPVVCVSHNDALKFLGWLKEQEEEKKRGYRLPTEAEWEYACRAGTRGLYGGDDDPESLVRVANVADASYKKVNASANCIRGDDGYAYTSPVGSFVPSPWQLYDMIGNVWEWCDDWFDPKFYQSSPKENPHNTKGASPRVIRGGCWHAHPGSARPACRYWYGPESRRYGLGFRVAAVQE